MTGHALTAQPGDVLVAYQAVLALCQKHNIRVSIPRYAGKVELLVGDEVPVAPLLAPCVPVNAEQLRRLVELLIEAQPVVTAALAGRLFHDGNMDRAKDWLLRWGALQAETLEGAQTKGEPYGNTGAPENAGD